MERAVGIEEQESLGSGPIVDSVAYDENPENIGNARAFARAFLTRLQSEHGVPVSERAMGTVQLVVSELVTNAVKYSPSPSMLNLELDGSTLAVTVWDSDPVLPVARAADPGRVGQHGLEIVMAVCQGFEVRREPVGKRTRALIALADDVTGRVL